MLLAAALPLAGCEMLSGGDKGKDGESIGYACRLSDKLPEDCMKENPTYTPTSILTGWKRADTEKKEAAHGPAKPADEAAGKDEANPEGTPAEKPAAEADKPAAEQPAKH